MEIKKIFLIKKKKKKKKKKFTIINNFNCGIRIFHIRIKEFIFFISSNTIIVSINLNITIGSLTCHRATFNTIKKNNCF